MVKKIEKKFNTTKFENESFATMNVCGTEMAIEQVSILSRRIEKDFGNIYFGSNEEIFCFENDVISHRQVQLI